MRPLIKYCGVDGLDASQLRAESQHEHHQEEQNGPDLWRWHVQNCFRISDEGERRAGLDDLTDLYVHAVREESQNGEHDEARHNRREKIRNRDVNGVAVAVVVELRKVLGQKSF